MGKVVKKKKKKVAPGDDPTAGKEKKVEGDGAKAKPERKPFTRPELYSKPKDLQTLFNPIREAEVNAEIVRPRMQTESVEHGRGQGLLRHYSFRKFKEVPKAVLFINQPRSQGGGAFEPTSRLLTPGEQLRLIYTTTVEGADRPVYFLAKGFFLRKSFFIPEDPKNPGKPWIGSREDAEKTVSKDAVVRGEDVMEIRVDSVNSFPGGPGRAGRDVLDRYLSQPKLLVFPGGGGWNQKSTQGNFFDAIRDPLDKYVEREDLKVIDPVVIDEFLNSGEISVLIKEQLIAGIDHEVARPSVIKKPNDNLGEINIKLGFLLYFRMDEGIAESLARTFPQKAGKEVDVYLPLILDKVADSREEYRVTFRVFPRDLIEARGKKTMERGLKFQPPYALHQGSENQTTFSKLLILLSQRFNEDEKPEEDKLKSEKLKASVDSRINERKDHFTDEKLAGAFKDRAAKKRRKDEGG
mgnify:CR=1 FL=1|jgi:hypothetical protein